MNQFVFQQGYARELIPFPHIVEFVSKKNLSTRLNSLPCSSSAHLRIYHVLDGKFDWQIDGQPYQLFPGDMAVILPEQSFGNARGVLEIGSITWLNVSVGLDRQGLLHFGDWSSLSETDSRTISQVLRLNKSIVLPRLAEASRIFMALQNELGNHEIGYGTRVNHLLDELMIVIARQLTKQNTSARDFPRVFLQLEQKLRENLAHQWTVDEMAASVGMGTTLFNEKVKNYSGFSPLNYLINIRISEAIKLLKKPDLNVTDIALDTGFYSSQHFSTTFKKLTGYTPSEFRKQNVAED
jgi:AraC-like DNA-binding protein